MKKRRRFIRFRLFLHNLKFFVYNKLKRWCYMLKKVIIGFLAGFVSGLFASGGGLILLPAFVYILKETEVKARATTIFCILPLVIISGINYYNNNLINWSIALKCAFGGIIGGIIGSKVLNRLPDITLKITFIIFLIYTSSKIIIG